MDLIDVLVSSGISLVVGALSFLGSRLAARDDKRKLLAQWKRSDIEYTRAAFTEMTWRVDAYCRSFTEGQRKEAVKATAAFCALVNPNHPSHSLGVELLDVLEHNKANEAKKLLKQIQEQVGTIWDEQGQTK